MYTAATLESYICTYVRIVLPQYVIAYHCACTGGGCLSAPVEDRLHALGVDHIGAGLTLASFGTEPPETIRNKASSVKMNH